MGPVTETRFSLAGRECLRYVMGPITVSALCVLSALAATLSGTDLLWYIEVPGVFWLTGALLPFLTRYRYLLRIGDSHISKRCVLGWRTLKWSDISKATFLTDFKGNTLEIWLKPLRGLPMVVPLFLLGNKADDLVRDKVEVYSVVNTRRSLLIFGQANVDFFFWLIFLIYVVLYITLRLG